MSDKELIEEAWQEASIHDKLGDGFSEGSEERAFYYGHRDRYKRLADALAARQPSEDDRERFAKQLRDIGAVIKVGEACCCEACECTSEWVNAPLAIVLDRLVPRAAVPDAATEGHACALPGHAGCTRVMVDGESWSDHLPAERDAATEALERVRAAVESLWIERFEPKGPDSWYAGIFNAKVKVNAALDGAPEPEGTNGEWVYGAQIPGQESARRFGSRERAEELKDDAEILVRSWWTFPAAGPWLPVESEGK